jgi:hypothetical protein
MQIKNIDMPLFGYIQTQNLISCNHRDDFFRKQFKIPKTFSITKFLFVLFDLLFHDTLKLNITQFKLLTKNLMINRKKIFYLLKKYKMNYENINYIIKNNQISLKSVAIKAF